MNDALRNEMPFAHRHYFSFLKQYKTTAMSKNIRIGLKAGTAEEEPPPPPPPPPPPANEEKDITKAHTTIKIRFNTSS